MHKIWQSHNATVSIRDVSSTSYLYVYIYIYSILRILLFLCIFCRTHVFLIDLTIINGLFRLHSSSWINIIILRVKVSSYIIYRHPKKSGFLSPCLQEIFNYLSLTVELYLIQHHLLGMAFRQYVSFYVCG